MLEIIATDEQEIGEIPVAVWYEAAESLAPWIYENRRLFFIDKRLRRGRWEKFKGLLAWVFCR